MTESISTNPGPHPRLREALEKVRPEMVALGQEDLLAINIDPLAAASTARGALPQIMAMRASILVPRTPIRSMGQRSRIGP